MEVRKEEQTAEYIVLLITKLSIHCAARHRTRSIRSIQKSKASKTLPFTIILDHVATSGEGTSTRTLTDALG